MPIEESLTFTSDSDEKESSKCWTMKARHVLALMAFLAQFNLFSLRINLSVAIIAMVNRTGSGGDLNSSLSSCTADVNLTADQNSLTSPVESSTGFPWSPMQQGLLLGSYFYGYLFTNVPGAWLARKTGFKKILFVSMFISSIVTILTPAAAYVSFEMVVVARIVLGFFQGLTSPVLQGALASWTPPKERSTVISLNFAGSVFGICVILPFAGVITDSLGWEAVYYLTGGLGLAWSLASLVLIYDSPRVHPRISHKEKSYIISSLSHHSDNNTASAATKTPWCKMLLSPAVLGINVGLFCGNWGDLTVLMYLPMYMSKYLGFDLSTAGALSSLPFMLKLVFTIGGGYASDAVLRRKLASTVAVRKINTTLGLLFPGMFLVLAGYVGCNVAAAVAFFTSSVAFSAFTAPGFKTNTVDIAPAYAGILYGIANTVGTTPGFLSAQITGLILQDERSLSQWQTIFWICAIVQLSGAGFYLLVGSGQEQSWARGKTPPAADTE